MSKDSMIKELEALATKWERIAEGFDRMGSSISQAEAASMRNDAMELRELIRTRKPMPSAVEAQP